MGVDRASATQTTWSIPAAPRWPLDHAKLLEELGSPVVDEALGAELLRTYTAVRAWAEAGQGERTELFAGRPSRPDEHANWQDGHPLSPALAIFHELRQRPHLIPVRDVVIACRQVALWTQDHGLLQTAVHFSSAAAAADPGDPALANLAAKACRRAGDRARSEMWHERAFGLARATQNVRQYIEAHRSLGRLHIANDRFDLARPHLETAARTARRKGLKKAAGGAYHELLGYATLAGLHRKALEYGERALRWLPLHHKRTPALAYDLAFLAVNLGAYTTAGGLLNRVVARIHAPDEQVVVLGTLARACGGTGDVDGFVRAAARVETLARAYPLTGAGALCGAAEGARLLQRWDLAAAYTNLALNTGRAAGADLAVRVATELGGQISARATGMPPIDASDPRWEPVTALINQATTRLEKWRGPSWRRRRRDGADDE
jgi:tetratricopeptide (TPR) repeat protein